MLRPFHPQDSAQQTMLLLWLVELYLNDLKSEGKEKERRDLQSAFHQFLATPSLQVRGSGGGEEEGLGGLAHPSSSPGPSGGESEDHI